MPAPIPAHCFDRHSASMLKRAQHIDAKRYLQSTRALGRRETQSKNKNQGQSRRKNWSGCRHAADTHVLPPWPHAPPEMAGTRFSSTQGCGNGETGGGDRAATAGKAQAWTVRPAVCQSEASADRRVGERSQQARLGRASQHGSLLREHQRSAVHAGAAPVEQCPHRQERLDERHGTGSSVVSRGKSCEKAGGVEEVRATARPKEVQRSSGEKRQSGGSAARVETAAVHSAPLAATPVLVGGGRHIRGAGAGRRREAPQPPAAVSAALAPAGMLSACARSCLSRLCHHSWRPQVGRPHVEATIGGVCWG